MTESDNERNEPGGDVSASEPTSSAGGAADASAAGSALRGKPTLDEDQPKGVYLTPRRLLTGMAIFLGVVLIALIIYLLLTLRSGLTTTVDGASIAGIKAELVVEGPGTGATPRFSRPMGAAWDPDGRYFYVADTQNNRVCVFNAAGRFVNEFGGFGIAKPLPGAEQTWNPGELNYPTDVATDDEGNVYVADFYNDSISVFTANGAFLRRFPDPYQATGKGGSGHDGKGIAVSALTVKGDRVYATDAYQVVVFDLKGKLLMQFGKPGAGPGDLDHPNGITVDDDGRIIVSDSNNNRVAAYSPQGRVEWVVGSRLAPGSGEKPDNPFVLPRGLTLMNDDELLVADPLGQRLVVLSLAGDLEARIGRRGTSPSEINFPNDVDWHGGRIVVADRENDRVQVVRLVEE